MNTASFRRWLPASATFDPSLVTEKFFKAVIAEGDASPVRDAD